MSLPGGQGWRRSGGLDVAGGPGTGGAVPWAGER